MKFNIGDRVVVNTPDEPDLDGLVGTVVHNAFNYDIKLDDDPYPSIYADPYWTYVESELERWVDESEQNA